MKLWGVLGGADASPWGVGPTTASKIPAGKRPHLIPIWDVVIGQVIWKRSSRDQWLNWYCLLQPGTGLVDRMHRIQVLSTVPTELSQLRTTDAILWRHGRDLRFMGGRAEKPEAIK